MGRWQQEQKQKKVEEEQKKFRTKGMTVTEWNETVFCSHTVPVMFRQNYTGTAGEFAASECVDANSVVRIYDQLACQEPKVEVARDRMGFGCACTDIR